MTARSRLALDVALFFALLAAYNPALTGIAIHEWLSIAIIAPLLFHLVLNWEWTVRIVNTFLDRLLHSSRINLIVDIVLFLSTVTVMLSGLLISQVAAGALGLSTTPSALWVAVHAVTADTTIFLLLTHFALHTNWVARVVGTPRRTGPAPAPQFTGEATR